VIQEGTQLRATSGEEPAVKEEVRFLGLDVHAETIAVAARDGEVRRLGTIANCAESVRKSHAPATATRMNISSKPAS
jgi:hypothetical protein